MPPEQLRNFLLIGLCVVGVLLWQAWVQDYRTPAPAPATTAAQPAAPAGAPGSPEATQPRADVPQAPSTGAAASGAPTAPTGTVAESTRPLVDVRTDLVHARIDPIGGTIASLDLLAYPLSLDTPDQSYHLFERAQSNTFIAQSGLIGGSGAPTHHTDFASEQTEYVLAPDGQSLEVRLSWQGEGLAVTRVYTFRRGSYVVDVEMRVRNQTGEPWSGRMYGQFTRNAVSSKGGLFQTYTYTGGVVSGPDKPYEKISFDDMESANLDRSVLGGWAAMIQHYFASAWIPRQDVENHYYTKSVGDERYVLGVITPEQVVAPNSEGTFTLSLFAGPKLQDKMEQAAPNLARTVDYGWLWLIAQPLFWLLQHIHALFGNWGVSIILLTCLVKLVFFYPSAASYKSMAKMRKVQPRMVAIRERYGSDRQRMNQAMMELYKTEKINPLGGCLPIVIQIPVFISLYWVLLESVELRQAPFVFWLKDLSTHDPYFVLPLLMGTTMFIQQRLNPAPPDPMQAKIMMALPIVFTFLFLFFPSGLVLYWFVNNLLSIIQQWVITRKIIGPNG
ncbi:MAG: membrane protein insertase YidC [Ectothiorhodospiraceae bacterium]|nr:membrane protein insertase YidC [Chromatiales bacterium]MCP5156507.1 membrane protein insertase YidC [Ectothiorhodospiraceae bacterium]